jgi:hypothetical protein
LAIFRSLAVSCPAASRILVRIVVDDFPSLIGVSSLGWNEYSRPEKN